MKHIYCIGIGGIGVSGLARYYLDLGYKVSGSDSTSSALIDNLIREGCNIHIGSHPENIRDDIDLVIYTEAIEADHPERQKIQELQTPKQKYNEALGKVVNNYKLIAVTGTHGKSTTSSMIARLLYKSEENFKALVGTKLTEFEGRNFYSRGEGKEYFVIEACEHKEHFLAYRPIVAVITNIEYDHADYFQTPDDYLEAYKKFIENIVPGGFCIINGEDENCKKLLFQRKDISYITLGEDSFTVYDSESQDIIGEVVVPNFEMQIPGEHVLYDAKLAFIVSYLIGIDTKEAQNTLETYSGVWRRMEIIGLTQNGNILMSDYAHHPTEIEATLKALREGYPEKNIFCVFQPHQYSRTIELYDEFLECFSDADKLLIPNIYQSRDTKENIEKFSMKEFIEDIDHSDVTDGEGLENTLEIIQEYDNSHPDSSIIILTGAGDIDTLRYQIKTN